MVSNQKPNLAGPLVTHLLARSLDVAFVQYDANKDNKLDREDVTKILNDQRAVIANKYPNTV